MKPVQVIDTNIILRYLLADHLQHFEVTCEFMTAVETGRQAAYVPESVLAECVFVLLKFYRVPRAEIAQKLHGILSLKGMVNDNQNLLRDALERFRTTNLSIVDALVWTTAEQKGWTVFSFDEELNKRANTWTQFD